MLRAVGYLSADALAAGAAVLCLRIVAVTLPAEAVAVRLLVLLTLLPLRPGRPAAIDGCIQNGTLELFWL